MCVPAAFLCVCPDASWSPGKNALDRRADVLWCPMEEQSTVLVVDDDPSMRAALAALLRSVGLGVRLFGAAHEFLQSERPDRPGCLVLDVRLPGVGGLDFQRELARSNIHLPIIFITGHGDIPMTVPAMKAGAVEFLTKPFRDQDLLDAIQLAIQRDRAPRHSESVARELREHPADLTPREREIRAHLATVRWNKQSAGDLPAR